MSRESIFEALATRLATTTGAVTVTRRVKLWSEYNPPEKPAICIATSDNDYQRESEAAPAVITLNAKLFVYVYDKNDTSDSVPSTAMNTILDAIDTALRWDNLAMGNCTLGGICSHCWIDGKTLVDPGDIDGDGVAIINVKILIPGFS